MFSSGIIKVSYIVVFVLFIFSIASLSNYNNFIKKKYFGIIGILISLFLSIFFSNNFKFILVTIIIGFIISIFLSKKTKIIQLHEKIVFLHSFIGLSTTLVTINSFIKIAINNKIIEHINLIEFFFGFLINFFTFISSIILYLKLSNKINFKYKIKYNNYKLNLFFIFIFLFFLIVFVETKIFWLQVFVLLLTLVFLIIIGYHFVFLINKLDIPIVIYFINSCSGWSVALCGFILFNNLLIITGSLVGISGAILYHITCKLMNRSFIKIFSNDFNSDNFLLESDKKNNKYQEITPFEISEILKNSTLVVMIPCCNLVASKIQYHIFYITKKLQEFGIKVNFCIHPITENLLGYMDVLFAETNISCKNIFKLNENNFNFQNIDTVLIFESNDIVNPDALENSKSSIFGMKVLEVWKANNVIVLQNPTNICCSYVQNSLFFKENVQLLFGEIKNSIDDILYFFDCKKQD
ncbi:NAD(P)(+) transhydrogenase (Re/Si-specific) subunit beta [Candidatus Providencia siddallii]|uniref:proton-translocating NAD(P)(+) transhydrogenase n=1 Tax=Candidatus Providencia siddallii TaxID=1715285 RepID=A0ABM9NPT4_9GAMM